MLTALGLESLNITAKDGLLDLSNVNQNKAKLASSRDQS